MKNNGLMSGETVMITGCTGSIGSAVVKLLADEGAALALLDCDEEGIKAQACETERVYGVKAKAYCFNVTDFGSHKAVTDRVESDFGPVTVLINCAGITRPTSYDEVTPEEYDLVMNTNLKGPFFFTREIFR